MHKSKGVILVELYNRIVSLCAMRGIRPATAFSEAGLSKSAATELKSGRAKSITAKTADKLADYFGVSVDYLLGKTKKGTVLVPVYGRIAAGIPDEMIEDIEDYEEISEAMASQGEYLALKIKGDSMEPKFSVGDVIIIRKQETCEDGEICAVMVNGDDATCKRVKRMANGIALLSTNPKYEPMYYTNEEIENLPIRILGKVVELRAKF